MYSEDYTMLLSKVAWSDRSVEYNDCISAERKDSLNECLEYDKQFDVRFY